MKLFSFYIFSFLFLDYPIIRAGSSFFDGHFFCAWLKELSVTFMNASVVNRCPLAYHICT